MLQQTHKPKSIPIKNLKLIDLYKLGYCKLACESCNKTTLHEPFKMAMKNKRNGTYLRNMLRCPCGHETRGISTTFDREKQLRLEQLKGGFSHEDF